MSYTGYIYKVVNNVNQKVYIGQTARTVELRWKQHIKDSKKYNFYFYNAINYYGIENFIIETLEELNCKTLNELKEQLNEKECYYIKKLDCHSPKGYNSTYGGDGFDCKPISLYDYDGNLLHKYNSMDESSENTGLACGAISNNCQGKTLGTRVGIFRYDGEPFDKYEVVYRPDFKKPIIKYDLKGNVLKEYGSYKEYADEYGTTKTNVGRYITNHTCIKHEHVLFLKTEPFNIDLVKYPIDKRIKKYSISGELLEIYESASEAARNNNTDASSIIKCCNGKYRTLRNFIYRKYKDEYVKAS